MSRTVKILIGIAVSAFMIAGFMALAGMYIFSDSADKSGDVADSDETALENTVGGSDVEVLADDNAGKQGALLSYLASYEIDDSEHGAKVSVVVDGETRTITSNTLPNHEIGTFPNEGNPNTLSAQERTWTLPVNPVYTGAAQWAREAGVAINGVKFEPQTAERLTCASGEVYSIEALEGFLDFGVDINNAHVQPTGEYHYHGISQKLVSASSQGEEPVHIGFANDGFLIYYSPSKQYTPSFALKTDPRVGTDCAYEKPGVSIEEEMEGTTPDGSFVSDWEFVEGTGNLDQCNGTEINGEYAYVMTDDYPYIPRCLNGEFSGQGGGQGSGQGQPQGQDRPEVGAELSGDASERAERPKRPEGATERPEGGRRGGPPGGGPGGAGRE